MIKAMLHKLAIGLALPALALAIALAPAPSVNAQFEDAKIEACKGAGLGADKCETVTANKSVSGAVATALNILSFVVGVVAIIMVIVGGLKFVTSRGDASNVAAARSTVMYAVIGLVIVAAAQAIVRFVLLRSIAS